MGKSRDTANLVSDVNVFSNISNERVGIGTTNPSTKLQVAGDVSAVDYNSTSDRDLKINIESLSGSIDILNQMNPVSFNWKDTGDKSYGLIAQELETILPELVKNVDYKNISYIPIIAFLIDAVKKHEQEIADLKKKISE